MPPGAIPFPFGICRVCKDKATGVHYGVATCEGCKGFFKRTITRGDKYKCFFGGSCDIVPKNRNRCKSCRFRRCLETGMSVEAVRMGRIPKVEKEKALEVFQQTGSDFNKMEIVVQHSGTGQSNTMAGSDDEPTAGKDEPGGGSSSGNRTCTIQVSISNDRAIKQEQEEAIAIDGEHGKEIDAKSAEFESRSTDQNCSSLDVKPSTTESMSGLAQKSHITTGSFSQDTYSGMLSSTKSLNRPQKGCSGPSRDISRAEQSPTIMPQNSHPQFRQLEQDSEFDVKSLSTVNHAKGGTEVPPFAQFTALNDRRVSAKNEPRPRISARGQDSMNSTMDSSSRNPGMDPISGRNPGNTPVTINTGINQSSRVQGMVDMNMDPRFRNPNMVPSSRHPGMDSSPSSRHPGMNPSSRNLVMDPGLRIPGINTRFGNPEMELCNSRKAAMDYNPQNVGMYPRSKILEMAHRAEIHDTDPISKIHGRIPSSGIQNINLNSRNLNFDPSFQNPGMVPSPRAQSMELGPRKSEGTSMVKSIPNAQVNPSFQHGRKEGSMEIPAAPTMNWAGTQNAADSTLHSQSHSHYVGDLFSDNFDIDTMASTSVLPIRSQSQLMGAGAPCQFTTSSSISGPNHQPVSTGGGNLSVSNPWSYNESFQAELPDTKDLFMSQGDGGGGERYLPLKKQCHQEFTVLTTEFQRAHDDLQGLEQLCVQDNNRMPISSMSSVNQPQPFSGLTIPSSNHDNNINNSNNNNNNGQLGTNRPGTSSALPTGNQSLSMNKSTGHQSSLTSAWPTGNQSSILIDSSIAHPLPPETPSSIVSSGSSRYSSQWSSYSPSLLKVLMEHILESREEKSIIERLRSKFNSSSNSANSTVQMFLKLVEDTASKAKMSDQMSSSSLSLLQQTKTNKSDHMQKFLSDVESFMKTEAQSTVSQQTASMYSVLANSNPHMAMESNTFSSSHVTDALQSTDLTQSRNSGRRPGSDMSNLRQEACSPSSNSQFSAEMMSDSVSTRFRKKQKREETSDMVSSSFTIEDEEDADIKLTLDCMELAKDILYRLKPEHRQKLRLHKAGQIQLRVMTDSDEDVEEVYSKIFQSIPQLNERVIGFCDNVRGFFDLPVKDKEKLQKRAFYDIWMLTYAEYFYDGESHIILSTGELYSTAAMRRILNDKMVDTFLEFSKEFNSLKLSDIEISTLCAIQLTSHDGLALEDQAAVQRLHSHLIDVFDWEIKRNHGEQHSRLLLQIFKLMPTLAVINRLQQEIIASYPSNRFNQKNKKETSGEEDQKKSEDEVDDRESSSMS